MAELPLLSYADIIGMNYIPASAGIVLSAAEQTLACQAVAIFGFGEMWSDYDQYADDIEALMASTLNALLDTEIPPPEVGMQSELFISPLNMTVIAGNAVLQTIDSLQRFNGYYQQNAAAINQNLRAKRWMAAGVWSYKITALKTAGSGILRFQITDSAGNNAHAGDHDFYNATTQRNQFFSGGFTLPVSGETLLDFKTLTKNAASSGYLQQVTCLEMWRTA